MAKNLDIILDLGHRAAVKAGVPGVEQFAGLVAAARAEVATGVEGFHWSGTYIAAYSA
jgi:hypothetical protein